MKSKIKTISILTLTMMSLLSLIAVMPVYAETYSRTGNLNVFIYSPQGPGKQTPVAPTSFLTYTFEDGTEVQEITITALSTKDYKSIVRNFGPGPYEFTIDWPDGENDYTNSHLIRAAHGPKYLMFSATIQTPHLLGLQCVFRITLNSP